MFTKEEKNKIYIQVLKDIKSEKNIFCCASIGEQLNTVTMYFKTQFPELYNLKTTTSDLFWFNNRQERIEALKKCVELTK